MDLQIHLHRPSYAELNSEIKAETSADIRQRVEKARQLQELRFQKLHYHCNAKIPHYQLKKFCPLSSEAQELLKMAFHKLCLSARSYDKLIRVARTIADLDNAHLISAEHIAEAINLKTDLPKLT